MVIPDALLATPLSAAVSEAQKHIQEARDAAAGTAQRCGAYLEAIYSAMQGLEGEYEVIVAAAEQLDPSDANARSALLARIGAFVTQEDLRPLLVKATEGLRESRKALREDSDRFLTGFTPRVRERKRAAVTRLTDLLDRLLIYLDGLQPLLEERYLRDRRNASAPELPRLLELEDHLRQVQDRDSEAGRARLNGYIGEMRRQRDTGQFLYVAKEVGGTAEQLRTAFG